MSLESLHIVLNVASAILLGPTFIVGAGAIITGLRLGNRQAERIAVVTHETAMANKQKPTQTRTGGGRLKNYRGGGQFYGMAASGVDNGDRFRIITGNLQLLDLSRFTLAPRLGTRARHARRSPCRLGARS